jgi:aerobic carbon-monoxide dehydrogenase small subunit
MTTIQVTVNDRPVLIDVPARTSLADLLREHLGLTGTHLACEHGVCGACTILLDDKPVRSCIVLAAACEDRHVRTIEGFERDAIMSALREAFKREHGLQCGFCTPGMLIMGRDIALRLHGSDGPRIRRELSGNLCRCTGYVGIVKAVQSVASMRFLPSVAAPALQLDATPVHELGNIAVAAPVSRSSDDARRGWTKLTESFIIDAPADAVWAALLDIRYVASCLPGAEITDVDRDQVSGRMTIKLGPIRASMSGSASIIRDPVAKTGELRGGGSDRASGSRTQGRLIYSVKPDPNGDGSLVEVAIAYNVQGTLAQFTRSGVSQEVGRLLIRQFADSLNESFAHGRGSQPNKAYFSVWSVVGLFLRGTLNRLLKR